MVRINKIYTKSGDQGKTQVIGGMVAKSSQRLAATGALDELNALIGQARTIALVKKQSQVAELLEAIQQNIFNLGAEMATVDTERLLQFQKITEKDVLALEEKIDLITEKLPELTSFVLPGGDELNASLHLARTVCRRAEREFWILKDSGELTPEYAGKYLNRLSDFLFALAREASRLSGTPEFLWKNT